MQIGVRELRSRLRECLLAVERGEEVTILRRGVEVARLVRPARPRLPDLHGFRQTLTVEGPPLSATVVEQRRRARY